LGHFIVQLVDIPWGDRLPPKGVNDWTTIQREDALIGEGGSDVICLIRWPQLENNGPKEAQGGAPAAQGGAPTSPNAPQRGLARLGTGHRHPLHRHA
jgi:hypothetical protein